MTASTGAATESTLPAPRRAVELGSSAFVRVPALRPIQCTIPRRSLAIVAAVCAAAFAALAIYLWESPHRTAIERHITDAITSTTKDSAYRLFDAIGVFGSTGVVAVASRRPAAFALAGGRRRRL